MVYIVKVYIVKAYKITASIEKNPESTNLPAYIFSYPAICSSLIVCCFTNRAGDMMPFFGDLFHFFYKRVCPIRIITCEIVAINFKRVTKYFVFFT